MQLLERVRNHQDFDGAMENFAEILETEGSSPATPAFNARLATMGADLGQTKATLIRLLALDHNLRKLAIA